MIITVKTLKQEAYKIEVKPTDSVRSLKEKLQVMLGEMKYPLANQRLIYAGAILDDSKLLSHYNIEESKFVVVMMVKEGSQNSSQQHNKVSTTVASSLNPTTPTLNQTHTRSTTSNPHLTLSSNQSSTPSLTSSSLEDFQLDPLVSSMLQSNSHASLSTFDFNNFFPPIDEILQSALGENNLELPEDVLHELSQTHSLNEDGADDFQSLDVRSALDQLNTLVANNSSSVEELTRATTVSNDQTVSQMAAAMALRDTANHMGISVEDAIALLTSPAMENSTGQQLQDDSPPDGAPSPSFTQPFLFQLNPEKMKDSSHEAGGVEIDHLITNIMALGFDKESVQMALAASHNDPDLAVEYLAADPVPMERGASDYSIDPMESFDLQAYMGDNPDVRPLIDTVRRNPNSFPNFLQLLADDHPQLLQYINSNQNDFMQLLTPLLDSSSPPQTAPSHTPQLSTSDRSDIEQLQALGFSEIESVQAYLACDKDVQMAADLLLSDFAQ